jgi:hypothetical protein
MWNVFAWRVKANLVEQHQESGGMPTNSLNMIDKRFHKMKQQFTLNCPDDTLEQSTTEPVPCLDPIMNFVL